MYPPACFDKKIMKVGTPNVQADIITNFCWVLKKMMYWLLISTFPSYINLSFNIVQNMTNANIIILPFVHRFEIVFEAAKSL